MLTLRTVRCSAVADGHEARTRAQFDELAHIANVQTTLRVSRVSQASLGLVTSARAVRGDVLMRVPKSTAIVLDYNSGLSLPASASWPRWVSGQISGGRRRVMRTLTTTHGTCIPLKGQSTLALISNGHGVCRGSSLTRYP
jgi:hypothetical protein